MPQYRIEYDGQHYSAGQRLVMAVPDVQTALVVADINRPHGDVELWDGDRQIARLHRERGGAGGYWQVG